MSNEITAAQVADKALDKATMMVERASDMATDIFSAAAGIMTKGVEQYGPQVIDSVLWVVRLDAFQFLLFGWLSFFIIVGIWTFIWTGFTRRNWSERMEETSGDGALHALTGAVVLVSMIFFMSSTIWRITDVWKYTALVKPELYLVKKTVDLVERKLEAVSKK